MIRSVLFDFGGVISTSPFDAFERFERQHSLPEGCIRRVNATNPDGNAWAQLERGEIDVEEFCRRFEAEAAAAGHRLDAREMMSKMTAAVRPEMVEVVRRCAGRYKTACLTNNFAGAVGAGPVDAAEVLSLFDVVLESHLLGIRKPEPRFYEIACEELGVAPHECVYLDDLGVNLKPARQMGMTTIKVAEPDQAIAELAAALDATWG